MRSWLHFVNQIIVLPPPPAGAIYVGSNWPYNRGNFHHSGGNISVEGTSAGRSGGAVLESSSGVAGDGSGCL